MGRSVRNFLTVVAIFAVIVSIITLNPGESAAQVRAATTKNIDEPGRQPYEVWVDFNFAGCEVGCSNYTSLGDIAIFDLPPVPAGKRLVIRHISGRLPTTSLEAHVAFQAQRVMALQSLKWTFFGPFYLSSNMVGFSSEVFTTYGPGETPHVNLYIPSHNSFFADMAVSGYLIDAN
jgi:hypothetical protein